MLSSIPRGKQLQQEVVQASFHERSRSTSSSKAGLKQPLVHPALYSCCAPAAHCKRHAAVVATRASKSEPPSDNDDDAARDNRANQLNPNKPEDQGGATYYQGTGDQADLDNHANQMNPNNPSYYSSREGSDGKE